MLSDRLKRILRSKTSLTDEELNKLSEADGWQIVYSLAPAKKENKFEICFTGFNPADKTVLIEVARTNSFYIASTVTKNLKFLCIGDNAGPSKLEKAKKQGTQIITKDQFFDLLETGQLPTAD